MQTGKPKVSVLMAAYNEQSRLKDTVDSVLAQTYTDFEFIVVDDGSKDSTGAMLEEYCKMDSRIKILKNTQNLGLAKSLNAGLRKTQGQYIARIDAGDSAHPDRLKSQVRFMESNPQVHIVGTFAYWIDSSKRIIGVCRFPVKPEQVRRRLFGQTSVALHPSLLIKMDLFSSTGLFDETHPTSMEYELYLRTVRNGLSIANIPEYLMYIQRDTKGISVDQIRVVFIDQFKIRMEYLPNMFNPYNLANTLFSGLFILIPSPILKIIVDIRIALSNKRIVRKDPFH